jgi:hypothetical protein
MWGVEVLADGSVVYSVWLVLILVFLMLWELVWKGLGMWRAGRKNQPVWFVLILILNTLGILPIVYLVLSKDKKKV